MFLAAQAVFAAYGMPSARLTDGDALRVIAAGAILSPQFPLIALAIAHRAAQHVGELAVMAGDPPRGGMGRARAPRRVDPQSKSEGGTASFRRPTGCRCAAFVRPAAGAVVAARCNGGQPSRTDRGRSRPEVPAFEL